MHSSPPAAHAAGGLSPATTPRQRSLSAAALPAATVLLLGLLGGGIGSGGLLGGLLFLLWVLSGQQRLPAPLWLLGSLLGGLALAAHLLPGFASLPLAAPRAISPDAAPYTLKLHWDKLLLGATLLGWWLRQPRPNPTAGAPGVALCALATLLAVPPLALALGMVAWQPKWPAGLGPWLAVNLGVTVLAEELLFRGLLQRALVARLGAARGVALGAALFGLAHLPFSPAFALIAALAGLGYGCVVLGTGRLRHAVLLHGTLNLLHFLLLSYPLRLA